MFDFFKLKFSKSPSPSAGSTSPTNSLADTSSQKTDPVYNGFAPTELRDKIVFAFKSGNRNYFMLSAELNMPYTRFMAALDIYDELEQGLNPGVNQKFLQTLNSICTDPKLKTVEQVKQKIGIATFLIQERINIHVSLSSHMKLATVRYFDENEDITGYDHEYNIQKIKHWTENHDVQDFFFMQPILAFLPQLTDFQGNLAKYLEGETVQLLKTMEVLSTFDTSGESETELQNYLSLQTQTLEIMKDWANSRSMNTAS
jgi:hypothetical protein